MTRTAELLSKATRMNMQSADLYALLDNLLDVNAIEDYWFNYWNNPEESDTPTKGTLYVRDPHLGDEYSIDFELIA